MSVRGGIRWGSEAGAGLLMLSTACAGVAIATLDTGPRVVGFWKDADDGCIAHGLFFWEQKRELKPQLPVSSSVWVSDVVVEGKLCIDGLMPDLEYATDPAAKADS